MSASPNSTGSLPNPDTYLNHLAPKEAIEYEISRNITLLLLGAMIWDIVVYIPDDIQVVKRSRFLSVILCFIFSRLFAAGYILSSALRRTMSVNHIHAVTLISVALLTVSIGCSSYLFLQRVCAVYADSPRVRLFFSIFWLIYALSEILIFVGVKPTYIPGTQSFKDSGVHPATAFNVLVAIIYDSSVFLAISYKIAMAHVVVDRIETWGGLPLLYRAEHFLACPVPFLMGDSSIIC